MLDVCKTFYKYYLPWPSDTQLTRWILNKNIFYPARGIAK